MMRHSYRVSCRVKIHDTQKRTISGFCCFHVLHKWSPVHLPDLKPTCHSAIIEAIFVRMPLGGPMSCHETVNTTVITGSIPASQPPVFTLLKGRIFGFPSSGAIRFTGFSCPLLRSIIKLCESQLFCLMKQLSVSCIESSTKRVHTVSMLVRYTCVFRSSNISCD